MSSSLVTPNRNCQGPDSSLKGSSLRWHVIETLKLAPGIVLARSGIVIIILVDTIIVSRHSSVELGYFAIGNSIVQPIIVTSVGLILGTLVLTANHYGARNYYECGRIWRRSIKYSLFIGCLGLFFCFFGEEILKSTGQSQALSLKGGQVIILIGLGVPAHLIFLASSFFLEGIGRVMPGAVCMVIANVVNFLIAIILVNGSVWNAPLGAEGAAWAATAARWVLAIGMLLYILTMREHLKFGVRNRIAEKFSDWRYQRRLGYAMGLSMAVETVAFSTMQQFAGWLNHFELAAFAIAFQLLTISFMVAVGVGSATAVRVGVAYGRGNLLDVALAGWSGLGIATILNALIGLFIIIFVEPIAKIFTNEIAVLSIAMPLFVWVAVALVTDGGQAVIANVLRGRRDVWIACIIQGLIFLGLMVPLTWFLAYPYGNGAIGLFQGVLIAATLSNLFLGARFQYLYVIDRKLR